jgi:hypothetical protein
MIKRPAIYWIVDMSSGKEEKIPLKDEIGREALLGHVLGEAEKIEMGVLKHEDLCQLITSR